MFCMKCGAQNDDHAAFCQACGAEMQAEHPAVVNNQIQTEAATEYPMKWYKFLIYFALYAGMVLNVINVLSLVGGIFTMGEFNFYYIFDIVSCILLVLNVILAWKARKELAAFMRTGPASLNKVYMLNFCINLVSLLGNIMLSVNLGYDVNFVSLIVSLVMPLVVIKCNKTYFEKRASLFVN